MIDSAQVVVTFINAQPESVRDGICTGLITLSGAGLTSDTDELAKNACDWISQGSGLTANLWVAAAIGVLDVFFAKAPFSKDQLSYHAEQEDSDFVRALAQQAELRNAMFERAKQEWRKLRETSLRADEVANQ